MKHLPLTLLLLPLLLDATENYLFPDQSSDAHHTLKKKILRAEKEVVLVSSAIRDKSLIKAIEKALQGHRHVTFITSSDRHASFFAKYRNADIRVLKKPSADETGKLNLNYLLLDETELCLSTLPFDNDATRTGTGAMQCTVEPETVRFYRHVSEALTVRSDSYLE